jgi:hypothetical protein
MRPAKALLLPFFFVFGAILCFDAAADGMTFGGSVEQDYLVSTSFPAFNSSNMGASTTFTGMLKADRGQATCHASISFVIFEGSAAHTFWTLSAASATAEAEGFVYPQYSSSLPPPDTVVFLSVPELSIAFSTANTRIEAGRFILKWGVGKAFSPVDFFSRFDYGNLQPTRVAESAARLSVFPSTVSSIEVAAAPFDAQGGLYGARFYSLIVDTLAMGSAVAFRQGAGSGPSTLMAGAEMSFDLPFVSPYAEIAAIHDIGSAFSDTNLRFMSGFSTRVAGLDFTAEYLFDRQTSPHHSLYAAFSLMLSEWAYLSLPTLYYPDTESYASGLTLTLPDVFGIQVALSTLVSHNSVSGTKLQTGVSGHFDF